MYDIERRPEATIVYLRSEAAFTQTAEFFEFLLAACDMSTRLVVSLHDCPAIDCAGLSALVRLRNVASIPISIVVPNDSFLFKIFSTAGLREPLSVIGWSDAASAA